jgi:hypothetical protein
MSIHGHQEQKKLKTLGKCLASIFREVDKMGLQWERALADL